MPKPSQHDTRPAPAWSLLCYMAADNDLSPYGLKDIEELASRGCPPNMHVGIELDTLGAKGSIRYEISPPDFSGRGYRTVVERLSEQDTGDFKTLRNFLNWGIQRANAGKRCVVIWGHGMGNAVAPDFQSMGGSININELADAFEQAGFRRSSKKPYPSWSQRDEGRVAILGFDACNMASIENVWSLRENTQMVVASQEKVPATGWPYETLIEVRNSFQNERSKVGEASTAHLKKIARKVLKSYIGSYEKSGITAVTMSATLTDALGIVVNSVNTLGAALCVALRGRSKTKAVAVRSACKDARLYAQGFHLGAYVDLVHFCSLLIENLDDPKSPVRIAAVKVVDALNRSGAVTSSVGGVGRRLNPEVANATGLSIWFPAQRPGYMTDRNRYARENGADFSGWRRFLDAFHG